MKKFRFFLDSNKEEKWLNDMSKRGYQLDGISFGYILGTQTARDIISEQTIECLRTNKTFWTIAPCLRIVVGSMSLVVKTPAHSTLEK